MEVAHLRAAQLSIALEVISFVYFVATVREFLPNPTSEPGTKAAIDDGVIDALAAGRQAFAHNPSEAWEAISALRRELLPRAEPLALPRAAAAVDGG